LLTGNNFCLKPDTTHKYVTLAAILQHARGRSFMENHHYYDPAL
jgi:hypothetical protein